MEWVVISCTDQIHFLNVYVINLKYINCSSISRDPDSDGSQTLFWSNNSLYFGMKIRKYYILI